MFDQPHNRKLPAPLEGTGGPRRALFVKRWGTLLRMPESSVNRFDPELLMPGAIDALFRASQAGWWIYLIGNEEEVSRGRISQETWGRFEAELIAYLRRHGVRLARSYSCIDDPADGIKGHTKESVYRLPNTGAMYHAHQEDGIELRSSWVLGDDSLELAAGWRAGCLSAGVLGESDCITGPLVTDTAFIAPDLCSALEAIISAVRAA